jgi:hypothetical protein
MAASFNDMAVLSGDTTFKTRVLAALIQASANVGAEQTSSSLPAAIHLARKNYAAQVLGNPSSFQMNFVYVACVDSNVIAAATQNGTVALTAGNVATQAALVTDAIITTAIATAFNYFIAGV